MYEFDIPDMSCGHCVGTVTQAIKSVDPAAVANVDLTTRKAPVETNAEPGKIGGALDDAGSRATYTAALFGVGAGRQRPAHLYPRSVA